MTNEDNLCWYHENLTRKGAEDLLLAEGNDEDGVFLVRASSSAAGDYVLSVLHKGEVVHCQIRRHGEDAFFSIDGQTITHGLETLIELYQNDLHGLVIKLQRPIRGTRPPHDSRRHGHTNLLHRATKEGDFTVVSELLKCGYRSLEAKNQNGQTAVHLASWYGRNEILSKLIDHGANVNCRDTDGYTPLHYACQNNLPDTVQLLIESGGANIQIRNTKTTWVPLHEAASRGYIDVVKTLIALGAPLRPRTEKNEIPARLAEANGHIDCAKILDNCKTSEPSTSKEYWYHGTLDRNEAVAILNQAGNKDGSFLVRYSDRSDADILTMIHDGKDYHFQVQREGLFYFIDDGPLLDSLEHVVEHYKQMPDGLPTILLVPLQPKPKPPLPPLISFAEMSKTLPPKHHKRGRDSELRHLFNHNATLPLPTKTRNKSKSPLPKPDANMNVTPLSLPQSQIVVPVKEEVEEEYIPFENLILKEVLGEGEFGSVYKAIYQNREGYEEEVAVKTLHEQHVSTNKDQFLKEVKVMVGLNHHCIVRLIGLSIGGPSLLMVQELAPFGSMLTYLLTHKKNVTISNLKLWAWQIACGMKYLESQKRVHRDLAARNILLSSKNQAKVSDFGLSRYCNDHNYYTASQGGRWPIKWYAPESYNRARFTSASDVWSYGVTLWEMFSYGQQPYGEMRGQEAIDLVERGERLEKPEGCPNEVYQTMEQCWAYRERDRPTFSQLVEIFTDNTYINIRELVTETDIS